VSDETSKCEHKRSDAGVIMGPIWLIGWLFTIGFLDLSFWRAVLAILIWPYLLGNHLH
jgi:hypothetical protein